MQRTIWRRRSALLLLSGLMAGFGLTGIASAQTITKTGPYSTNSIDTSIENECKIKNDNDITVRNTNYQTGSTGDASVTGNTTAGSEWGSWQELSPSAAITAGTSHDAWWNGVVNWMGQHGTGDGWSGTGDNPAWSPSGNDWASYDPMSWQANGQTFGNWWNATQHYLDDNSAMWLLGWPEDATGSGSYGGNATSGSVINRNNSNFTISVDNAAAAAAGVDACGKSKFTPPKVTPPTGGKSASSSVTPGVPGAPGSNVGPSGAGGAGAGAGQANIAGLASHANLPSGGAGANVPSVPSVPAKPAVPPREEQASISNTGPGSNNSISTTVTNEVKVTNTNDVNICNTNYQTGSTGDASVSDNTRAGSATSGDVYNTNKTQVDVAITN